VLTAIEAGYRHIDTAKYYDNEASVGEGIKTAISRGLVMREDLFVTTKCKWDELDNVEKACKASMASLGLDYLDLYLIHWPHDLTKKNPPMHKVWA